ncbi:hypothetical protein F0L68_40400 [Solihabitans fulvus]|uniref:Uncharacterized protein n=1 Tax=Solihabitans fulvus TaxID=1892852 RepID=A0A5B2W5W0_9PSEU|nr:hypothetical protein [Solihabitans fulvus]KAA2247181.1 hypothetical protein F0L68_40400 [Solihabitans fulvus]
MPGPEGFDTEDEFITAAFAGELGEDYKTAASGALLSEYLTDEDPNAIADLIRRDVAELRGDH